MNIKLVKKSFLLLLMTLSVQWAFAKDNGDLNNVCDKLDERLNFKCTCNKIKDAINAECTLIRRRLQNDDEIWDNFELQNNITHLTIKGGHESGLDKISTRMLSLVPKLEKLKINVGKIDTIESRTFANSSLLTEIYLKENRIEELLQESFAYVEKLEIIKLDSNEITEIRPGVFKELPHLRILHLNYNKIASIHHMAFSDLGNLIELRLDHNSIKRLSRNMFRGLANLGKLDLSHNEVKSLGDYTFTFMPNLQLLRLGSNQLKMVWSNSFDNLIHLKSLFLDSNKLDSISVATLENMEELVHLDLSKNRLQTIIIPGRLFENLSTNVSQISVEDNALLCDCRLDWIRHLHRQTKSEKTKKSLERTVCILESNNSTQIETKLFMEIRKEILPCRDKYRAMSSLKEFNTGNHVKCSIFTLIIHFVFLLRIFFM